jgi:hypothetical protein
MDSNDYEVVILTDDLSNLNCVNTDASLGLSLLVCQPTSGNQVLDVFFISFPDLLSISVACSLVNSDHLSLYAKCYCSDDMVGSCWLRRRKKVKCYNIDNVYIERMIDFLDHYSWNTLINSIDSGSISVATLSPVLLMSCSLF